METFQSNKMIPIIVGVMVIAVSAIIAKLINKKNKKITLIDSDIKYPLELIEKIEVSPDTRLFRFGLPTSNHILGLPVGQHIYLSAKIDGKLVVRPYTPCSNDDEDNGKMDLIVKIYFKNIHPKFPEGGKMSQYLNNMNIGDKIDIRGPSGLLEYKGEGTFEIKADKKSEPVTKRVSKISMIAGGTGLTPMYQLITAVFRNSNDKTCLSLLYANQTEEDIIFKKELEAIAAQNPDRFKLWYTLDRPKEDWEYSSGFISEDMISQHLFKAEEDSIVLMCGPPPMVKFACIPNLEKLGYESDKLFTF